MKRTRTTSLSLILIASTWACGTDPTSEVDENTKDDTIVVENSIDDEEPPLYDMSTAEDVRTLMRDFATGGDVRLAFTKVNNAAFTSDVDGTPIIEVYAPKMEASHYADIDPSDDSYTTLDFSLRTVLIAKRPGVRRYIVSAKLEENGADGWWYGVFDSSGMPIVLDDQGASCRDCHANRMQLQRTDFLHGVPRANLACSNPWLACQAEQSPY